MKPIPRRRYLSRPATGSRHIPQALSKIAAVAGRLGELGSKRVGQMGAKAVTGGRGWDTRCRAQKDLTDKYQGSCPLATQFLDGGRVSRKMESGHRILVYLSVQMECIRALKS